ncbi:hypothetical protein KSP39_PZI010569 [Platanthera zijinensis]|uniref:Uncharacterized protein n=1 Tax=Platanthera zijinensis TaxID=2320716 RepID=A0AAP0G6J8_9ASPA
MEIQNIDQLRPDVDFLSTRLTERIFISLLGSLLGSLVSFRSRETTAHRDIFLLQYFWRSRLCLDSKHKRNQVLHICMLAGTSNSAYFVWSHTLQLSEQEFESENSIN